LQLCSSVRRSLFVATSDFQSARGRVKVVDENVSDPDESVQFASVVVIFYANNVLIGSENSTTASNIRSWLFHFYKLLKNNQDNWRGKSSWCWL